MSTEIYRDALTLMARGLQNAPLKIFRKSSVETAAPTGLTPTFPIGRHCASELAMLFEGQAAMIVEGRRHELALGEPLLLLPYASHAECFSSKNRPYKLLWCPFAGLSAGFSASVYEPGKARYSIDKRLLVKTDSVLKVFSLCTKIEEAGEIGDLDSARLQAEILLLTCDALDSLESNGVSSGQELAEHSVQQTLSFIEENYARRISVNDIAQLLRLSPNYLNSIFRKATGKPILRYVIDARMEAAKKLLAEGQMPVKGIARKVGISDPLYFCRLFKARTGSSPTDFLAQERQGKG